MKPRIPMTGEIYNQVQIDGTYLPYGWCLLVALAQGKVIAWQWCDKENKNAYHALFFQACQPSYGGYGWACCSTKSNQ